MTDEAEYCDECNGPVMGRSRLYLAVSWMAYWIALGLPTWRPVYPLFLALTPRAGDIAFACTCRDKNDRAIQREHNQ